MVKFAKEKDGLKICPIEIKTKAPVQELEEIFANQKENEFTNMDEEQIMQIVEKEIKESRTNSNHI